MKIIKSVSVFFILIILTCTSSPPQQKSNDIKQVYFEDFFDQLYTILIEEDLKSLDEYLNDKYTKLNDEQKKFLFNILSNMFQENPNDDDLYNMLLKIDNDLKNNLDSLRLILNDYNQNIVWNENVVDLKWESDTTFFSFLRKQRKYLPLFKVKINGVDLNLLVDTGSDGTIIFKDKLSNIENELIYLGSNTIQGPSGKISKTDVHILKELYIGNNVIKNSIINSIPRPLSFSFCDGVIGWSTLSLFSIQFDYLTRTIKLTKPTKKKNNKNFAWCLKPIIRINDSSKKDYSYFFFNSGSSLSSFNINYLTDKKVEYKKRGLTRLSTINSILFVQQFKINNLKIEIGQNELLFNNFIFPDYSVYKEYYYLEGVIGIDIAQKGTILLDSNSGLFDFKPYSKNNGSYNEI